MPPRSEESSRSPASAPSDVPASAPFGSPGQPRPRRRALRRTVLLIALLFAGTLPAAAVSNSGPPRPTAAIRGSTPGRAFVVYWAPLPGVRVVRGFDPPLTPYGPGHLGVDLAASSRATVRAAGDGVVRFAGAVAGRGVVVLQHPDGISTEYEPLRPAPGIVPGRVVARGTPIGVIDGIHVGCPPGGCLHWGAKRANAYLDPLTLLLPLGPVRLLPWRPSG